MWSRTCRAAGSAALAALAVLACSDLSAPGAIVTRNVALDFSACPQAFTPLWLAHMDTAGAWRVDTATQGVYRLLMTQPTGAVAFVIPGGTGYPPSLRVWFRANAEWTDTIIDGCPGVGTASVQGTVAGLDSENYGVSFGGSLPSVATSTGFTIANVRPGTYDLLAYRYVQADSGALIVLQRGLTLANGGQVAVDFHSPAAFAPARAAIVLVGAGTSPVSVYNYYLTGSTCSVASLPRRATTDSIVGIPSAQQQPGDMHMVQAEMFSGGGLRSVTQTFHALAARTLTFPGAAPAPAITALTGAYKRLSAKVVLPAEYTNGASFLYSDTTALVQLSATAAYLALNDSTLQTPDLSALAGWQAAWAPTAATGSWTLDLFGATAPSLCAGGQFVRSEINGSY